MKKKKSSRSVPIVPLPGAVEPRPASETARRQPGPRRPRRRRVNGRFLAASLAAFLVLACGVHLLHGFQVRQSAQALRDRADQLLAQGETRQAINYLRQYVGLAPDDLDALALLVEQLEETAQTPRQWLAVYQTGERLLLLEPERSELRRRHVETALRLGRHSDAQEHLTILLASAPHDGELLSLQGNCHAAAGHDAEAVRAYQAAIDAGHHEPVAFLRLALLQRQRLDQPGPADEIMASLRELRPESSDAWMASAGYRRQFGDLDAARRDAERAMELDPESAEPVWFVADLLAEAPGTTARELEVLRGRLERAISRHAEDGRGYQLLSRVCLRLQDPEAAIAILEQGADALPERTDLGWLLTDLLLSQGRTEDARARLALLEKGGAARPLTDYLQARMLLLEEDVLKARRLFEGVRRDAGGNVRLEYAAGLQLAHCQGLMGNTDEQLAEYRRLVELDPVRVEGRLGLAATQAALGRTDEALATYQPLVAYPGVSVQRARLLLVKTLRQPAAQRDWGRVEKALTAAESSEDAADDVRMLRAELARARGNTAGATALPDAAVDGGTSMLAQVRDALEHEDWDDAARRLTAMQSQNDSVIVRLAWAEYWALRGGDDAAAGLARLEEGLSQFPADDRARLFGAISEAHFRLKNIEDAIRLRREQLTVQPYSLPAHFRLLELGLASSDDDVIDASLEDLQRLGGKDGTWSLAGQALRLVAGARRRDAKLVDAQRLLERVAPRRPTWVLVPLTLARIEELQGDRDRALRHYQQAIALGVREPAVFRRTLELMNARRMYAEAEELIATMQQQALGSPSRRLQQVAAEASLRSGELEDAIGMARQAVAADSQNAREQLWLGQVLMAAGRTEEAEAPLRTALELDPTSPEAWVSLVQLLVRTDRRADAETAVRLAREKLPAETSALALAHCHELLGQIAEAEENYRHSADGEASPQALRQLAGFYLRTRRPQEAEPLLQKMIADEARGTASDTAWARRALAAILARRDYASFQKALELLDVNLAEHHDVPQDTRLKVGLLARRPHRTDWREAIRLLRQLEQTSPLSPSEQLLLARLYERTGERSQADQLWEQLRLTAGDQLDVALALLGRELEAQRGEGAREAFEHLRTISTDAAEDEPASEKTAWLLMESEARVLALEGRIDAARTLLNDYAAAAESDQRGTRVARVATVQSQILQTRNRRTENDHTAELDQLRADAERWYRELAETGPEARLQLAVFLGRHGKLAEAVDLCEAVMTSDNRLSVLARAMAILRAAPSPDAEAVRRVEQWILATLQTDVRSVPALRLLADLREFEERFADAEELYGQILAQDPRNVIALNNLAWLTAIHRGRHQDAQELIDRAVAVTGPVPELLDTRGTIRLAAGRPAQALEDFQDVVTHNDTPNNRFHLAQAFWKTGNRSAARFSLKRAQEDGFDAAQAHPLERDAYRELCRQLALPEE